MNLSGKRALVTGGSSGIGLEIAAELPKADGSAGSLDLVTRTLGGLDILVNNAGGVRAGRLEAIEEDEIRQMVEVNLTGPILLPRAALPLLKKSADALVVNVSSGIALVGMAFYTPYATVKAGIAHFGKVLRRELDGEGVRVLTVYPTATETPMMATSGLTRDGGRETPSDVAREAIEAMAHDRIEVVRGGPEAHRYPCEPLPVQARSAGAKRIATPFMQ